MEHCVFCKMIVEPGGIEYIRELETDLFIAVWDQNPATPGHLLVIPKRHVQFMHELNGAERGSLIDTVVAAKGYIRSTSLDELYEQLKQSLIGTRSEDYINEAIKQLETVSGPPDAFNDGLNDGPAAGQTVPHFHWHVMPRWHTEGVDVRGGIRNMFTGLGNYYKRPS